MAIRNERIYHRTLSILSGFGNRKHSAFASCSIVKSIFLSLSNTYLCNKCQLMVSKILYRQLSMYYHSLWRSVLLRKRNSSTLQERPTLICCSPQFFLSSKNSMRSGRVEVRRKHRCGVVNAVTSLEAVINRTSLNITNLQDFPNSWFCSANWNFIL